MDVVAGSVYEKLHLPLLKCCVVSFSFSRCRLIPSSGGCEDGVFQIPSVTLFWVVVLVVVLTTILRVVVVRFVVVVAET